MANTAVQPWPSERTALALAAIAAAPPLLCVLGAALGESPLAFLREHPSLLVLLGLAFPFGFALGRLDCVRQRRFSPHVLVRLLAATAGGMLLVWLGCAVAGDGFPREHRRLFAALASGIALQFVAARAVLALQAGRRRQVRPAVVVGAGWAGRAVVDTTLREPRLRVRVAALVDDDPRKQGLEYRGVPVTGPSGALGDACARSGAALVILAVPPPVSPELGRALRELEAHGTQVIDMPGFSEHATGQVPLRPADGRWLPCGGGFEPPRRPLFQGAKRAGDLVAASVGLAFSLPLWGLVALLIRLDSPGPVFCRQEHLGRTGRAFRLIRFRTTQGCAGASRVTRVGRWLRRTRLEEIPQLLNVLAGSMSFVGPRPERPDAVARLRQTIPCSALRACVRPGLTGWAQVQRRAGGGREDEVAEAGYDLYYVKNRSLGLDLGIAFRALGAALFALESWPGAS